MEEQIQAKLKALFEADRVEEKEFIQALWSNYGSIKRYLVIGKTDLSLIVKQIQSNPKVNHPRAWDTDFAHQRKVKSYQVEQFFYQHIADSNDERCKLPQLFWAGNIANDQVLVLEDLDALQYSIRKQSLSLEQTKPVITWLANFHAKYMNSKVDGLWERGTYWHLATRPQEFAVMADGALKEAAKSLDEKLRSAKYQCLIHGDAKLANFCFDKTGKELAGVDFQYVGKGCGMQDLAYFFSSCLDAESCQKYETYLLDYYFAELKKAIQYYQIQIDEQALEQEWRTLYPYAWADFVRFLMGWMPQHAKLNEYAWRQVELALE